MEFYGRGDQMSVKVNFILPTASAWCCFVLLLAGCGREDAAYVAEKRRMQKVREFCDQYYPLEIPSGNSLGNREGVACGNIRDRSVRLQQWTGVRDTPVRVVDL